MFRKYTGDCTRPGKPDRWISDLPARSSAATTFAVAIMLSFTRSHSVSPSLNRCTIFGLGFLALFASLLIYAAGKGIDPTDESMYLLYYAAPARHLFGLSWFQFVGSLWHDLSGGGVFGLRLWGYATMFACAGLCVAALARQYPDLLALDYHGGLALLTVGSMCATLFMPVILTPGYNSITACGLALTLGGVALIQGKRVRSRAGSLFVGFGCALVLFGKPSSLPALLVLLGLWAWRVHPGRRPVLLGALICAVTVPAVIAIHLPIAEIWRLVWEPIHFLVRFSQVTEPMHIGGLAGGLFKFFLIFCSLAALAAICPASFATPAILILSVVIASMLRRHSSFGLHALAFSLALGLIISTAVLSRPGLRRFTQPGGPPMALILLSFALPFCYFLGSAVPLTMVFGNASFFWWITVLLCLGRFEPLPWAKNLSLFCFIACGLWLALWSWHAFSSPYRHEARIWEETTALQDVPGLERIHVTPAYNSWIQRLRVEAATAGFQPETPILDITGGGPGTTLFLGGTPEGANWIPGGYAMSTEYLRFALDRISPEERRRCWILRLRDDMPRLRFDFGVLREYGIDLEKGYVAVWQDSHPLFRDQEIVLLRPVGFESER